MESCLACELSDRRREVPGGSIHETELWRVEHTVGPLSLGTLIVKPKRHVIHVADPTAEEAIEVGPLLRQAAGVVAKLIDADHLPDAAAVEGIAARAVERFRMDGQRT
jgi:diadenosine tetraphosphate (Ap4A) HIT family hydrolase